MTSKSYEPIEHACVRIDGLDGLWGIILHTGVRVWVEASHAEISADRVQVGDGITQGFGRDGICLISVPAAVCTYYTQAEADLADE